MARTLTLTLALTTLSGCGAARETIVAPRCPEQPAAVVATASIAPDASAPEITVDPCAGHDGLVIDPLEIAARWDGGALVVGGEGGLHVRWCGRGIATLTRIEVGDELGRTLFELDPAWAHLTYGESFTRVVLGRAAPSIETVRVIGEVAGAPIETTGAIRSVDAPELATARHECAAAGGTFGPVGMASTLACTRPTSDAGARCYSSAECEGFCLADGFEDATSAPEAACPEGTTFRLRVGHCDAVIPHFGCFPELSERGGLCFGPRSRAPHVYSVCHD